MEKVDKSNELKNDKECELKINQYSKLDKIKDCEIDTDSKYKYIQIKIQCEKENKIVIRGWKELEYHKQNYNKFKKIERNNLLDCKTSVPGGGRIEFDSENKKISIYGYSKAYGRCDHSLSCDIIKKHYPDYICSWSNLGY